MESFVGSNTSSYPSGVAGVERPLRLTREQALLVAGGLSRDDFKPTTIPFPDTNFDQYLYLGGAEGERDKWDNIQGGRDQLHQRIAAACRKVAHMTPEAVRNAIRHALGFSEEEKAGFLCMLDGH